MPLSIDRRDPTFVALWLDCSNTDVAMRLATTIAVWHYDVTWVSRGRRRWAGVRNTVARGRPRRTKVRGIEISFSEQGTYEKCHSLVLPQCG